MEPRILRGATERTTNQINDTKSNVETNELQVEFKTNEKLETLKKQIDLVMMSQTNNAKLLNSIFTTSTECNHVLKK